MDCYGPGSIQQVLVAVRLNQIYGVYGLKKVRVWELKNTFFKLFFKKIKITFIYKKEIKKGP